ncbi:MAG: SurA N-terminal domain-containing protein [Candidatus Omnitrophota bacterium]
MIRILGKKKVAKRIFFGLAVVIVPSFLVWGVGTEIRGMNENLAVKVNRQGIPKDVYYKQLDNVLSQYRKILGQEPADNSPEMESIKKEVLDGLVRQTILFQESRRRHIRVTDKDILEAIKNDPNFRDEKGVFDENRFQQIVARIPENEWLEIEGNLRKSLTLQKLRNLVVSEARINVTEQDLTDFRKTQKDSEKATDDALRQMMFSQKASGVLEAWYQKTRAKAKVKFYI